MAFPPGQCTSPLHHPCYRLFGGIKTVPHPPFCRDLALCEFWLFPKLRGYRYETIEEIKKAVTKVIDTRGLSWGLAEVVGTVQQVHCSWRGLLRRGLEFHVCTINKRAHPKKVWKFIVCTSYHLTTCIQKVFRLKLYSPIGWGGCCWIRRLHLCWGVRLPTPNNCPVYNTKSSDGEAPVLNFRKCGLILHYHYSQVHSNLDWL